MRARNDRHYLITGASSGLGAALAIGLAPTAGALTLMGRDPRRLDEVAQACRALGATAEPVGCDVTDAGAMRDAVCATDDRRAVDVVVANAGIGGASVIPDGPAEPQQLAHDVVAVNLLGVVNTVAPLQERFLARRQGHLVLIASMAAFEGLADAPMYAASKAAVRIYGHGLRRRLAAHGISVTVVSPGFVDTPMSRSLPMAGPFPWRAEKAARRIIDAIERREADVAFPWQLRLGVALSRLLPIAMADRAMAYARARLGSR